MRRAATFCGKVAELATASSECGANAALPFIAEAASAGKSRASRQCNLHGLRAGCRLLSCRVLDLGTTDSDLVDTIFPGAGHDALPFFPRLPRTRGDFRACRLQCFATTGRQRIPAGGRLRGVGPHRTMVCPQAPPAPRTSTVMPRSSTAIIRLAWSSSSVFDQIKGEIGAAADSAGPGTTPGAPLSPLPSGSTAIRPEHGDHLIR